MIKITILFLLANSNFFSAPDSTLFFNYHENINNAELLTYDHNLQGAVESYTRAFKFLTPVTEDLFNASVVASLNKEKEYAEEWLSLAFSRNLNSKVATKNKILTRFLGRKRIQEIYKNADRSRINIPLRKSIDSLIVIDQKNRSGKGDMDKDIDTRNAKFLLNLIKTDGFPTEERIGYGSGIDLLFMHNLSFWLSDENYEILKNELYNGNISPELFALLKDRMQLFQTRFKERIYYLPYNYLGNNSRIKRKFSVIPIDKYVDEKLIPEIDNERSRIALIPVKDSQKLNEKSFIKKYKLLIPMMI